jgi:xanthine dehydrogenase accessory factor
VKDVYAEDFDRALSQLAPNHSSYLVIVTRGHRDDMRVLRWAVETPAKYIGMIGSQRKVIAIYKQLEKEDIAPEKLARVYAPVGLDIGAITPEEIAIAIVAEMIAIRRGAGSLNHKRSVKASEILRSAKQTSPED